MKSFGGFLTELQDITFDTSSAGAVIFKRRINEGVREIARLTDGVFLNKQYSFYTDQYHQFFDFANDVDKVRDVAVYVGTLRYTPREVASRLEWDKINTVNFRSDVTTHYIVDKAGSDPLLGIGTLSTSSTTATIANGTTDQLTVGDVVTIAGGSQTGEYATVSSITNSTTFVLSSAFSANQDDTAFLVKKTDKFGYQIGLFPRPVGQRMVIVNYKQQIVDMYASDYTTGTITTIANNGYTVTGSGTSWTVQMQGRWIKITATDSANTGDNEWYQIQTVNSSTSITLSRPYQGLSISTGSATYTIGQMSVIPEAYENAVTNYCLYWHFRRIQDKTQADDYKNQFEEDIIKIRRDYTNQTDSFVLDESNDGVRLQNPNLFVWY